MENPREEISEIPGRIAKSLSLNPKSPIQKEKNSDPKMIDPTHSQK